MKTTKQKATYLPTASSSKNVLSACPRLVNAMLLQSADRDRFRMACSRPWGATSTSTALDGICFKVSSNSTGFWGKYEIQDQEDVDILLLQSKDDFPFRTVILVIQQFPNEVGDICLRIRYENRIKNKEAENTVYTAIHFMQVTDMYVYLALVWLYSLAEGHFRCIVNSYQQVVSMVLSRRELS